MKGKGRKKNRWNKSAAMTVEASFIIPMSILAAGIILSLSFHVYQRSWYTMAACESVLTGSAKGILKGTSAKEQAEKKWNMLNSEFYLKPDRLSGAVGGDNNKIEVKISGSTPVWGRRSLPLEIGAAQKIIRPVRFIRKTAAWKSKEG